MCCLFTHSCTLRRLDPSRLRSARTQEQAFGRAKSNCPRERKKKKKKFEVSKTVRSGNVGDLLLLRRRKEARGGKTDLSPAPASRLAANKKKQALRCADNLARRSQTKRCHSLGRDPPPHPPPVTQSQAVRCQVPLPVRTMWPHSGDNTHQIVR